MGPANPAQPRPSIHRPGEACLSVALAGASPASADRPRDSRCIETQHVVPDGYHPDGYHSVGACTQLSGRCLVPRLSSGTLQLSNRCSSLHFSPSRSLPVRWPAPLGSVAVSAPSPALPGRTVGAPTSAGVAEPALRFLLPHAPGTSILGPVLVSGLVASISASLLADVAERPDIVGDIRDVLR